MKKSHWLAVLLLVLMFAAQSVPAFALPDLKATANAVATYASGDAVWIPITVTRTGDPLTQSTYVSAKLCLSTDATWDAGDTLLWSSNDSTPDFAITVLNSTGVRTVSAPVTIPAVAPGVYYLIAFADPSNLHAESDETNNWTAYAVTISATSTQEWSYAIPAAEQEIPIGGFKSFYIPVSGAPSNAVISSIEAKFDYIASGGVESQLSARFNRAFDPGSAQGQVLVSQGSLAAAAPGTFGYLAYPTQFENAAVNANYFFRFSLGSAAPSAAAIRQVYVRITYILPAYDYRFAELVSRNSPTGWALSTDVGITGISTYPEYAWSSDGNGFSAYLPMNNFYNWGATTTFYDRRVTADYGLSPIQFNGATFSWRFTSPGGTVETRARVAAIRQVGLFDHFELLNGGANPVVAWSNRDTGIDYWRIRVYDPAYNLIWQTNLAYVGEEVTYAFNNFTFTPGMEYVIRIEARENAAPIEYISGTVPISPSNITLTNRSQVDIRYNTAATPATLDSDGDGVPDSFEIPNNLNPWVNDAQEDADSDGFSNLREYLSGSDPTFSRSTPAIMFDLDGDGDVDGSDLFILSSEMGRTDCAPATPCPTDFNEDGKVDQNDLGLFTSDYSRRTDTDGDGILDDGDDSGVIGDRPCTGGSAAGCDDNCINTPNPNQADLNGDGIGDVCAAPDPGILTPEELAYLSPAEQGEIYLLTGPDLVDQGLEHIHSREILKAKSYFKVAASKLQSVNTGTAHTAWFFRALTRVSALAFDSATDGVEDGLQDIGDVLDRAGYTNDPVLRDPFNYDALTRPQSLAVNSPRGSEMQQFLFSIVLPELQAALEDLTKVPQTFNARWAEPLDGTSVESDYGDVLAFRAALNTSIGLILIQHAHSLDADIALEYNAYYGLGNTIEDFLSENPTFGNLAALNDLQSSRTHLDAAATDALSAIDWIQAETDAQSDDYVTLRDATPEQIANARTKLAAFKQSLYGQATIDDGKTPGSTSDDTVIDSSRAFTGLDPRSFLMSWVDNVPIGFLPDPSFGGALIQLRGNPPTKLNDDRDGNGTADIYDIILKDVDAWYYPGAGGVYVSWEAIEKEIMPAPEYRVYWQTTPGVTQTSSKITTAQDWIIHTGVTPGAYYYRVSAVTAAGEGPLSDEVPAFVW